MLLDGCHDHKVKLITVLIEKLISAIRKYHRFEYVALQGSICEF